MAEENPEKKPDKQDLRRHAALEAHVTPIQKDVKTDKKSPLEKGIEAHGPPISPAGSSGASAQGGGKTDGRQGSSSGGSAQGGDNSKKK